MPDIVYLEPKVQAVQQGCKHLYFAIDLPKPLPSTFLIKLANHLFQPINIDRLESKHSKDPKLSKLQLQHGNKIFYSFFSICSVLIVQDMCEKVARGDVVVTSNGGLP